MSLGALPGELLEHIVHLMHAYDQAVRGRESWTSRTVESICKRRYASTSSSLGFGVHSLSLVNKRLRELTLPYLCQVRAHTRLTRAALAHRALYRPSGRAPSGRRSSSTALSRKPFLTE